MRLKKKWFYVYFVNHITDTITTEDLPTRAVNTEKK